MIVFIQSCKKGEDDPWLSFRSREQRLVGKWKLVQETITTETINYRQIEGINLKNNKTINFIMGFNDVAKKTEITPTEKIEYYTNSTYQKKMIFYGDTASIQDSIFTYFVFNWQDTIRLNGTYEIIVDIKKEGTYDEQNNVSLTGVLNGKQVSRFYNFDCASTALIFNTDSTYTQSQSDNKHNNKQNQWTWTDNIEKNGVNAGYLKGNIKRLSNNEIIIETVENQENIYYNNSGLPFYSSCFQQGIEPVHPFFRVNTTDRFINKKTIYQKWERVKD